MKKTSRSQEKFIASDKLVPFTHEKPFFEKSTENTYKGSYI